MRAQFTRLLLSLTVVCFAKALVLPSELSEITGLSEAQLRRFLDSRATSATTSSPPQSTCAEANTTVVFPKPTLPTAYDLAKRNAFVKRDGTKLTLLGKDFRIVGGNIYWLGLDENVIPDPSYPSKRRVVEVFGIVSAMRGTAVRGHTLGISVGNPLSVEPSLGVFNDAAYESIDFAILVARLYGIKLLIPLVDNYNWYHGGRYQFIGWHGIPFEGTGSNITPPDVGAYFYNTTAIVDSFKRYITQHLTHVNRYTGIALKDDPTILGWESGNELAAVLFGDGPAPPAWTKEIGELVKSLAPNHLFLDGSYGIYPGTGQLENTVVDIFSDHFYPANITKLNAGLAQVNAVNRNYLAGEFDWVGQSGGDDVADFLDVIKETKGAGDFFWSIFGHDDQCCQYVEHDDGFSFYYQRSSFYTTRGDVLINHATQISGAQVPEILPEVACPAAQFPKSLLPPGFDPTLLSLI
ncbi:glycoside hydrolase [Sistotremastrum niveocremeum HHB9708]|uniref:mannan endo-1,4-beta-mannosidase n=1 Tax=Sistotremastrum niveocremeum HHB9708 TaxID=1314777 RepID=A0A164VJE4_9AGAM|nr:glycoside hydrolase [Sistotremastrum niveocremeum HHB9708]